MEENLVRCIIILLQQIILKFKKKIKSKIVQSALVLKKNFYINFLLIKFIIENVSLKYLLNLNVVQRKTLFIDFVDLQVALK